MRKILLGLVGVVCALFAVPAHAALPGGYTELEYIESTGTQYLDLDTGTQTGVFKIIADVYAAGSTSWQYLFGYSTDTGGSPLGVWVSNNKIKETFAAGNGNVIADVNKWEHIDITNSDTVTISDFYIFHVNPTGITSYTINPGRIKYLQLKKDGDTIRDMVSAKRNSDGAIGMYDTVGGRFYTNAGTGTFIAGPETTGPCANMFNLSIITQGLINSKNGEFSATEELYYSTDYVSITANTAYVLSPAKLGSSLYGLAWFNSNKQYISGSLYSGENSQKFVAPNNAKYVRFSVYEPYATETSFKPASCVEIQVATTKYVETQFSDLGTRLAAAVATVNTVVTNTINQAASIATLQSGKQTRPANDTCPAGKKCLLVTDENNVPHWYEIFDPINRWMEAFFKTNPDGQYVDGGADFRRWQGNPDFRKTYIDGSTSVYVRQWTEASPVRTVGGMYQTLPAGDIENAGSWAVEWDGTEGDIDAGAVYGIAKCTSVAGTFANKLTSANESAFYELPAPVGQTDRTGYERENFKQCWCKMTAVGVPGEDGTAANGDVYPVNQSSSAWVFADTYGSAANCANICAYDCADRVRLSASFRSAVFGLSE